jgi:hypothetical protein
MGGGVSKFSLPYFCKYCKRPEQQCTCVSARAYRAEQSLNELQVHWIDSAKVAGIPPLFPNKASTKLPVFKQAIDRLFNERHLEDLLFEFWEDYPSHLAELFYESENHSCGADGGRGLYLLINLLMGGKAYEIKWFADDEGWEGNHCVDVKNFETHLEGLPLIQRNPWPPEIELLNQRLNSVGIPNAIGKRTTGFRGGVNEERGFFPIQALPALKPWLQQISDFLIGMPARKGELVIYSENFQEGVQLFIKCFNQERRENLFIILSSILGGVVSKIASEILILKPAKGSIGCSRGYTRGANFLQMELNCGGEQQARQIVEILNLSNNYRVDKSKIQFSNHSIHNWQYSERFFIPHLRTKDTIFSAKTGLNHPMSKAVMARLDELATLTQSGAVMEDGRRNLDIHPRRWLADPVLKARIDAAREVYKINIEVATIALQKSRDDYVLFVKSLDEIKFCSASSAATSPSPPVRDPPQCPQYLPPSAPPHLPPSTRPIGSTG